MHFSDSLQFDNVLTRNFPITRNIEIDNKTRDRFKAGQPKSGRQRLVTIPLAAINADAGLGDPISRDLERTPDH